MRRIQQPHEKRALDEAKRHLCWMIRKSMARKQENQSHLAFRIGTSRARVCQVQCGHIEGLTFNQLFRYLSKLEPDFQMLVSF
jgi:hypothetical protein